MRDIIESSSVEHVPPTIDPARTSAMILQS
jgi:hypothetical protein